MVFVHVCKPKAEELFSTLVVVKGVRSLLHKQITRKKLTSWHIKNLLQQGKCQRHGGLTFRFLPSDQSTSRLAIIVSKKVLPKATTRNYFKRIQRVMMAKHIASDHPLDIVVIAHKSLYNVSQDSIYEKSEKAWQLFVNQ